MGRRPSRDDDPEEAPKVDPLKRVTVLAPYRVAHDGIAYEPNATATVPASVADVWILNRWADAVSP